MARRKKKKPSELIAVVALLLNIFVLPGLGTIVGGRTKDGVIQLSIFLVSIPMLFILIGAPIMFAIWIWGIVSGIQLIREAS